MPLVRVRYNPEKFHEVDNLRIACSELVPAVLNCDEGQLTPGSIEFFAGPIGPHDGMHCDVFIDVEAQYYYDRQQDLDTRTHQLHLSLKNLFDDITFAIWLKMVNSSWASDVHDPEFDGDMSVGSAFSRAKMVLTELRTVS